MSFEEAHIKQSSWKNQSILRHLDNNELAFLEDASKIIHYNKGEIIFLQGKHMEGCYLILTGIVKQYKTGFEGKDYILRLAKEHELLGYRSVLSGEPACNTSMAIVDSIVCYIPAQCVYNLVKTNGYFALEMLQIACRDLEESHMLITEIAQKSVKERLAELLITLKNKFGIDEKGFINIVLTREDFANIIGTATESVIRLLSEFKTVRYIDISGKKIAILNEKMLEKIAAM